MFDYARKLQLAASDTGRRLGMKAGAGVAALIGAGFLLAALWTFIDRTLGWGPLAASLIIGILFLAIAGIVYAMSNKVQHPMPSTDELKREVEARASLAAEAALDKAKDKAREVVDLAENKVASLMDSASHRAASFVDDAEARAQRFAHQAPRRMAEGVGLSPQFFARAQEATDTVVTGAQELKDRAVESRATPGVGIVGAFAVGLAVASKLRGAMRSREEPEDDLYDYYAEDEDEFDRV